MVVDSSIVHRVLSSIFLDLCVEHSPACLIIFRFQHVWDWSQWCCVAAAVRIHLFIDAKVSSPHYVCSSFPVSVVVWVNRLVAKCSVTSVHCLSDSTHTRTHTHSEGKFQINMHNLWLLRHDCHHMWPHAPILLLRVIDKCFTCFQHLEPEFWFVLLKTSQSSRRASHLTDLLKAAATDQIQAFKPEINLFLLFDW